MTVLNQHLWTTERLDAFQMYSPSIALSPKTDSVVLGLVVGKFEEPSLGEMPQGVRGQSSRVGSVQRVLAGESAVEGGQV